MHNSIFLYVHYMQFETYIVPVIKTLISNEGHKIDEDIFTMYPKFMKEYKFYNVPIILIRTQMY